MEELAKEQNVTGKRKLGVEDTKVLTELKLADDYNIWGTQLLLRSFSESRSHNRGRHCLKEVSFFLCVHVCVWGGGM